MPSYKAPVDDALFLLNDVFHLDRYGNLPGFADATPDIVEAVLREAGKFSEEVLTPLNRVGDREGCTGHDDGSVATPAGFKDAFKQLVEGGWIGISVPAEFGGQGLPTTLTQLVNEFLCSANLAFAVYPGLTQGAIAALLTHAAPELKAKFLPKMVEGVWTGTMNLTEAHCGTDLGLLRTKAVKQTDGSYQITGSKIFISAGEHDLAENIIHLVLARIEGAPAGTKGISLFVVPKLLVNDDGSLGAPNGVTCGSIEEKMGIHGNATCVMNYDNATGWLIGEENRGLPAMFTMMNEARLGVGVQGLALSEVAYQNAAAYAKERLQGRALTGAKYPDKPADPIVVHPDVRRTLMSIRAFNEAARALVMWTALQGDIVRRSEDGKERQGADDHMGLLTPVIKGVLTDGGFANTVDGAAGVRRPRLYRRARHGAVRARRADCDDLRRRQRHPGARPGRPQARQGRRPRHDGVLQRGHDLYQRQGRRPGDACVPCALEHRARPPAAGLDVVHAQRGGQARQCRRRRHRLYASVRPGGAGLHVGADRRSGASPGAEGERLSAAHEREARYRALFHGAHAAGNRGAPRPHPVGCGEHDGIAGRGILIRGAFRIAASFRLPIHP